MGLITKLTKGLVTGLKSKLLVSAGAASPWATLTSGAALMSAMGINQNVVTPDGMWLFETNPAAATDIGSGGNNLVGTNLSAVTQAKLGGTCLRWDAGTTDHMSASSSAALDITTGSVAVLWIGLMLSVPGTRVLAAKINAAPVGWQFECVSGDFLRVNANDGTLNQTLLSNGTTYGDGNAFIAMAGLDKTKVNEFFVVSDREARKEANSTLGSLTNDGPFRVGTSPATVGGNFDCRLCAVWTGAGAEQGFTQTHMTNLKNYLGI